MGIDYNPDAALGVLGMEILPRADSLSTPVASVASLNSAVVSTIRSTVAESIVNVALYGQTLISAAAGGTILAEFTAGGSEIPTGAGSQSFHPNGGSSTNIEKLFDSTTDTDAWQGVSSVSGEGNGVTPADGPTTAGVLNLSFDTAGALTGKRITSARFVVAALTLGTTGASGEVQFFLNGVDLGAISSVPGGPLVSKTVDLGEVWPVTHIPVRPADLHNLDGGSVQLMCSLNLGLNASVILADVRLDVDYYTENRLAFDVLSTGPGTPVEMDYTPHNPAGTGTLAKPLGSLSLILRQPRYGSLVQPFSIAAGVPYTPCFDVVPSHMPTLRLSNTAKADGTISALGPVDPRAFIPTDLILAGPVSSVDSQVYGQSKDATVGWLSLAQTITVPVTRTYAGVRLVGKPSPDAAGNVTDLVVNLRRHSDVGPLATATLTRAQVDAMGSDSRYAQHTVIQVPFPAPLSLTAGTQYDIEVISATPATWKFPRLVLNDPNTGGPRSFGGVTDRAYENGAARSSDFPWVLYEPVAEPGDFEGDGDEIDVTSATGGAVFASETYLELADGALLDGPSFDRFLLHCSTSPDLGLGAGGALGGHSFDELELHVAIPCTTPPNESDCFTSSIPYAALSWTPTAIGAMFAAYEIQRLDDHGQWFTIGYVNTESDRGYIDQEVRRGLDSTYRVRAVTSLRVASPWATAIDVGVPPGAPGLTFTSNFTHAAGVALGDAYLDGASAERGYTNTEATEQTTMRLSGRDGIVVFQPRERRFDQFSRALLVNGIQVPEVVGVHAFDPLKDLAKDPDLPYVCVRDENGDRWFAAIAVPDYRIREPFRVYLVTVNVAEVARIPTPTGAEPGAT